MRAAPDGAREERAAAAVAENGRTNEGTDEQSERRRKSCSNNCSFLPLLRSLSSTTTVNRIAPSSGVSESLPSFLPFAKIKWKRSELEKKDDELIVKRRRRILYCGFVKRETVSLPPSHRRP